MKIRHISFVLPIMLLSACGTLERAQQGSDEKEKFATEAIEKVGGRRDAQATSFVKETNRIWLGGDGIVDPNGQPLPFENFIINEEVSLTLPEIAARITEISGVAVSIERFGNDEDANTANTSPPTDLAGNIVTPLPALGSNSNRNRGPNNDQPRMRIEPFDGPFKRFLNQVAVFFDHNWSYEKGTIRFFRYETRHFVVFSGPIRTQLINSVAASSVPQQGGGQGQGQGGNELDAESETQVASTGVFQVYEEIRQTIEDMLPEGSEVSAAPSTGAITVTAPPYTLNRVARYLDDKNRELRRQVALVVKVVSINFREDQGYGFALEGVFQNLANDVAVNVTTEAAQFAERAGALTATILNGSSRFSGSELFLNAASNKGRVAVQTRAPVTAANHRPVSFQNINTQAFVASASQTNTSDVGSQTSLNPGNIITGFTLNLVPSIFANGEILLEYSINLSDPPDIVDFATGNLRIQIPNVSSRQIANSIFIESGNALVLAGFEQLTNTLDKANDIAALSKSGANQREVIAIIIEPYILGQFAGNRY